MAGNSIYMLKVLRFVFVLQMSTMNTEEKCIIIFLFRASNCCIMVSEL